MNILVIGDVVSAKGCEFLRSVLPAYKRLKKIDLCIANGENSAVGNGVSGGSKASSSQPSHPTSACHSARTERASVF